MNRWQGDFDTLHKYLKENPNQRLFQAITNCFGFPFLGKADTPKGDNFVDLWNKE